MSSRNYRGVDGSISGCIAEVIKWPVLAGDRVYRVINGEALIGEPNGGAARCLSSVLDDSGGSDCIPIGHDVARGHRNNGECQCDVPHESDLSVFHKISSSFAGRQTFPDRHSVMANNAPA